MGWYIGGTRPASPTAGGLPAAGYKCINYIYIWLRVYAIEMLCTIVKLHIRKEISYSESVCAWLCIQYNDNTYHISYIYL